MKKSKIWLNRIWLLTVIAGGSFMAVYFEADPVWAVAGMLAVFGIPFIFNIIVTVHEAVKHNRKHRTPGNTPGRLKGFVGGVPIFED